MRIGWESKDNLPGKWMWESGKGRDPWRCKLLTPLRGSCLQLPFVFRNHLLAQTGTWVWSRQHKSQPNTAKRKEEKKSPYLNRQLKNQLPEPSNQSRLHMEAAPAAETLARRLVWELCSRTLKGCGQVGGTSLCSGRGKREGTGALLWCA